MQVCQGCQCQRRATYCIGVDFTRVTRVRSCMDVMGINVRSVSLQEFLCDNVILISFMQQQQQQRLDSDEETKRWL